MSKEENKALIRREYEDGINRGNLDVLDELFAPDYILYFPGLPEPIRGREGYKQFIKTFLTAFPDLQTTIEELIAEGDKVVVRHTWRGTHKGDFQGVFPTGKQVQFGSVEIYRIVEGKIVEGRVELDNLSLLQQLEAVPVIK
jgi:steroid delta-isomerase-like uncharacterized protein